MHQRSGSRFAVAIHGGAGAFNDVTQEEISDYLAGLTAALEAARQILLKGGSSMEAVIAAVVSMEDNPMFNSGKGAVFTNKGMHELDAAVMDGSSMTCGAVAGVKTVKNPVLLAKAVMLHSEHVLLSGEGADEFARLNGIETVPQEYYYNQKRYEQWQKALQSEKVSLAQGSHFDQDKMGTVGAVALDSKGNLAAATSTGGLTNKHYGRIGDSPIIGAGTYANNLTCAISCTGKGEDFIRSTAAHTVHSLMLYKEMLLEAAASKLITDLPKGSGGLIAVDARGCIAQVYNSNGMLRGRATSEGLFEVALY